MNRGQLRKKYYNMINYVFPFSYHLLENADLCNSQLESEHLHSLCRLDNLTGRLIAVAVQPSNF